MQPVMDKRAVILSSFYLPMTQSTPQKNQLILIFGGNTLRTYLFDDRKNTLFNV